MALAALTLNGLIALGVAFILVLALIAAAGYLVRIYHSLVTLRNNLDRSFSNIEGLLKQRSDELPKLIGTWKSYLPGEPKTLEAVIEARRAWTRAAAPEEKARADRQLTSALKTLFAFAAKYPDLKSNANFRQLQFRLTSLEQEIAAQRVSYNQRVNDYNARLAQLPAKFVAACARLQHRPLLQAVETDRENATVSFT